MKKLFLLLRVYCRGLLRRRAEKRGLASRIGTAALMVIGLGCIAVYTVMLGVGLDRIGMLRLYPLMMAAVDSLLTLLLAISRAPATLFRDQDFDLVMSLPMPGWAVAAARLLELYAFELIYSLATMLPAGVTYAVLARPGAAFYPLYFLGALLLPMLPVLIGAVLGALIHMAGSAFRGSRTVSLVLTFIFTIGVMLASYSMGFIFEGFTPAQFIDLAGTVSGAFTRMYPPAALFGRAVTEPSLAAFAAFAGVSLGAFALLACVFGRWFVPLHTLVNARHTRRRYQLARVKTASTRRALLRREARRYFSSNLYVMNTAYSLVLSLIGCIALVVLGIDKLAALMELTGMETRLHMAVPFLAALLSGMCCTTAPSISMEGRQLWLALSLPVSARDYLLTKVRLNVLICAPFVLADGLLLAFALRLDPLAAALALLLPAAVSLFTAQLGLLCGLKWRRFDWTNEAAVLKQSVAVLLPMLAAMLVCAGGLGLTINVPRLRYGLVPLLTVALLGAADAGLYALICKNADKWVQGLREA